MEIYELKKQEHDVRIFEIFYSPSELGRGWALLPYDAEFNAITNSAYAYRKRDLNIEALRCLEEFSDAAILIFSENGELQKVIYGDIADQQEIDELVERRIQYLENGSSSTFYGL